MTLISVIVSILLISVLPSKTALADELAQLLARVEMLNIGRYSYTLGKVLTDRQKETARRQVVESANPGTYKFKDGDLYVVADRKTDRILIIYEHHGRASREKIQGLVGALFLDFGDPTVLAHDKILYWAFDRRGKLSQKDYHKTKEKGGRLEILATVKLNSSVNIMIKGKDGGDGSVYYIISSEAALKLIRSPWN